MKDQPSISVSVMVDGLEIFGYWNDGRVLVKDERIAMLEVLDILSETTEYLRKLEARKHKSDIAEYLERWGPSEAQLVAD